MILEATKPMSRRRPTFIDRLIHHWRRVRRHELNRTIRHMHFQEKRAAYVRSYVKKSLASLDRVEGKIQGKEQEYFSD